MLLVVSIWPCAIFSHQSGEVEKVCVCAILDTASAPPQTLNLNFVCANFGWHVQCGKTDLDLWIIEATGIQLTGIVTILILDIGGFVRLVNIFRCRCLALCS
ncbi:hypothetical protein KVT40_005015 [Elsinoe batatas]|uniref:Secreted protein n=1 Tax=Elsinoe batatas TaxID=2601811 RepID=A0A8K0L1T2_9PEZI|nr:hypothetical protein KVT40_005015 [Elsinoe batatas]